MPLDITIIGAGGAGGYFGARWAEVGHRVTLVARGAHLEEAIRRRGLRIESPLGDTTVELWKKLLFFVPVSRMGSVARAPIGVLRSQGETRALLEAAMHEVEAVGLASGVALADDGVERAMTFVDTPPFEGTSSLHRDFEAGRRTELEALAGAVVRIGHEQGVPTPVHDFLYGSLLPLERKARGELEW